MTSEAQNKANRANARFSTGPRTPEGKARVGRNSVTLGLFAACDLVHPEEQPEYDELRDALEGELVPATVMERTLAMEILHATWRLRRCSLTEAALNPDDAEGMASAQATIDRARANVRNSLHRATADLSRLQTERYLRTQLAPGVPETLVSHQAIAKTLANETRRRLNQRKLNDLDNFEAIFAAAAFQQEAAPGTTEAPSDPAPQDFSGPLQNKPTNEDSDDCGAPKHTDQSADGALAGIWGYEERPLVSVSGQRGK